MNQDQRKFLTTHVESKYKKELDALDHEKPERPNLNNHLVAAALDGTLKLKSLTSIAESIRKRVLSFGEQDTLVEGNDDYFGRKRGRHWDDDDDEDGNQATVKMPAKDLFVYPAAFVEAMTQYEKELVEWKKKRATLEALRDTVILKVRLGATTSWTDSSQRLTTWPT